MPILGYEAPPPKIYQVPDANSGTGGGGFTPSPSLEWWLQNAVQQMCGGVNDEAGVSSLNWPPAQVSAHLTDVMVGRAPYLIGIDPNADPNHPELGAGLVAKYTALFLYVRSTPAPPPLPPWEQHRPKPEPNA